MNDKQYQWNSEDKFELTGKQLEMFLTAETILKSKQMAYREFQFLEILNEEIGNIFETNKALLTEVGSDVQAPKETGELAQQTTLEEVK